LSVVRRAFARFASLTIDLRSMFAPAFGLRGQDYCLEPLGHLSVKTPVIPNPASSGEGSAVRNAESVTADPSPRLREG
jgi:hypothetical protein